MPVQGRMLNMTSCSHGGYRESDNRICARTFRVHIRTQVVTWCMRSPRQRHQSTAARGPLRVTAADFAAAETRVRPSAMREVALEVPNVSWDDVGGLDDVKQSLKVRRDCLPLD